MSIENTRQEKTHLDKLKKSSKGKTYIPVGNGRKFRRFRTFIP